MNNLHELSESEIETYARQISLAEIGYAGQQRIRAGRVCVLGVGGLGNVSSMRLTAMGVGFLRLVDRDVVSQSDLHRQFLYDRSRIGHPKVEVASEKLARLNPDVEIEPVPAPVSEGNVEDLVKDVDVVVDGLDRIQPRYMANRACYRHKIPFVFGSAIELYGNISTIIPEKTPCLECFYADVRNDDLPRCAVVGVHPSVVGVVGNLQAFEAVSLLLGHQPTLAGKIFYVDLKHMSFDTISIGKRPGCPVCSSSGHPLPPRLSEIVLEETCSREGSRVFAITPPRLLNVDLEKVGLSVRSKGKEVRSLTRLGISFVHDKGVTISLLKSGCMVVSASPNASDKVTPEIVRSLYRTYLDKGGVLGP